LAQLANSLLNEPLRVRLVWPDLRCAWITSRVVTLAACVHVVVGNTTTAAAQLAIRDLTTNGTVLTRSIACTSTELIPALLTAAAALTVLRGLLLPSTALLAWLLTVASLIALHRLCPLLRGSSILTTLPSLTVLARLPGTQMFQLAPQPVHAIQRRRLRSAAVVLRTRTRRASRGLLCLANLIAQPLQSAGNLSLGSV
jgi:hypothetical protein